MPRLLCKCIYSWHIISTLKLKNKMKKNSLTLFVFLFGLVLTSFAQPKITEDFFAGKWDVVIVGTPNGDAKMVADLSRTDGKLGGKLIPSDGTEAINITQLDEDSDKITLYFSAQGYDLTMVLTKVDNDNLKGSVMDMFEAKAVRVKN
jgi:hypothetical protein